MPVVTGIAEWRGIVRLSVDGRSAMRVNEKAFKHFPLQEGDALDPEEYMDRVSAFQGKFAYEAALGMLARSAKTAKQVERALLDKGYVPPVVEATLERLTEARLIDDRALAERMVEINRQKSVGRYALKRKLRSMGVNDEDAEDALLEIDDDQQLAACRQMAQKLYPRYAASDARAARGKLSQALARRGFGWDAISSAVDEIFSTQDEW